MIFLFKDLDGSDEMFKVTAESANEAIIKIVDGLLNKKVLDPSFIAESLNLYFASVDDLNEYE